MFITLLVFVVRSWCENRWTNWFRAKYYFLQLLVVNTDVTRRDNVHINCLEFSLGARPRLRHLLLLNLLFFLNTVGLKVTLLLTVHLLFTHSPSRCIASPLARQRYFKFGQMCGMAKKTCGRNAHFIVSTDSKSLSESNFWWNLLHQGVLIHERTIENHSSYIALASFFQILLTIVDWPCRLIIWVDFIFCFHFTEFLRDSIRSSDITWSKIYNFLRLS